VAADAGACVAGLYAAYQDRAWDRAAAYLHADAVVDMPATAERLVGRDEIIAWQRAYPEPWGVLTVDRVVADEGGAAARVRVAAPDGRTFGMAAFWTLRSGLLYRGVEYWVTVGGEAPPPERPVAPHRLA
jgi:ketosteroid isomerase-like protein